MNWRRLWLTRHLPSTLGWGWVGYRALYAVRKKSGALRRATPQRSWESLDGPELVFPNDWNIPADGVGMSGEEWGRRFPDPDALIEVEEIEEGLFRFYGRHRLAVGCPPDWHRNPFENIAVPSDRHWSRLGDFAFGDIKDVWELGRFGWAFPLLRAWRRTGHVQWPALFWRLLENWMEANPPNRGPHWMCGQEAAIRLMTVVTAARGFSSTSGLTAAQVTALSRLTAATGLRIEANFGYALSQRNNHGTSEAAGLFAAGLLLPGHPRASVWRTRGWEAWERETIRLVDPEGVFSQYSFNYQRLFLETALCVLSLARASSITVSKPAQAAIIRAAHFLLRWFEPASGQVPIHGANDGARLLPLAPGGYGDFRPTLQAVCLALGETAPFPPGPWDETAWWLGRAELPKPVSQTIVPDPPAGGFHRIDFPNGWAMVRAGRVRFRPSHADQLHVDLWWRGRNLAIDPGTYRYNAPAPRGALFKNARYHNTVTIDGLDQMEPFGRFLYLPWAHGEGFWHRPRNDTVWWEGRHNGYERSPVRTTHRRALLPLLDGVLVADRIETRTPRRCRLHWLLSDQTAELENNGRRLRLPWRDGEVCVNLGGWPSPADGRLVRADPNGTDGWHAPAYGALAPALSWSLETSGTTVYFWTLFTARPVHLEWKPPSLHVSGSGWQCRLEFAQPARPTVLESVQF